MRSMRSMRGGFIFRILLGCVSPVRSMRSMRSMRGGIIFRNRGPSLKVHHGARKNSRQRVCVVERRV
jgi:hypothetical protein